MLSAIGKLESAFSIPAPGSIDSLRLGRRPAGNMISIAPQGRIDGGGKDMSVQTASAQVIDLQAYRSDRAARRSNAAAAESRDGAVAMQIAWIPVWFMPVFFLGALPASFAR